jgi:hypothetical protein
VSRDLNFGVNVGGDQLTVADVEQAAEVLKKVSKLYDQGYPEISEWSHDSLLFELKHIKAALEQEALLGEIADKLVAVMFGGFNEFGGFKEQSMTEHFKEVLRGYEIDRPLFGEST